MRLLDNPLTALSELNRVCKDGGMLIIPTYMNNDDKGKTSGSLPWKATDSFFRMQDIPM